MLTTGTKGSVVRPLVFALSAQDKEGIKRFRQSLPEFLSKKDKTNDKESREFLIDSARTLNTRRTHHQWKTYAVISSVQELVEVLNDKEIPRPECLRAPRDLPLSSQGRARSGEAWAWS
jgi:acyl transferase domain-containing protein